MRYIYSLPSRQRRVFLSWSLLSHSVSRALSSIRLHQITLYQCDICTFEWLTNKRHTDTRAGAKQNIIALFNSSKTGDDKQVQK